MSLMSLQFTKFASRPAETGCETCERIVLQYYWPLLRNNNMTTNTRRCTSGYGGRRSAACKYWTQTSWQVMLRDSDWW